MQEIIYKIFGYALAISVVSLLIIYGSGGNSSKKIRTIFSIALFIISIITIVWSLQIIITKQIYLVIIFTLTGFIFSAISIVTIIQVILELKKDKKNK